MKADPQSQRRLLDLAALDTSLAQLAHRRRTLPEIAELERLDRELAGLEDERVRAQAMAGGLLSARGYGRHHLQMRAGDER